MSIKFTTIFYQCLHSSSILISYTFLLNLLSFVPLLFSSFFPCLFGEVLFFRHTSSVVLSVRIYASSLVLCCFFFSTLAVQHGF